mmetsp:Transcript_13172/g.29319  ORF Transcript_13172/g.29319 Transcript_13172/m.29319 type:complete len:91 (+) Transcript_13172:3-275(+)
MKRVSTLQGGYSPEAMSEALKASLMVLTGDPPREPPLLEVEEGFDAYLQQVRERLENRTKWWSVEESWSYLPSEFGDEDDEDEDGEDEED